MRLLLVLLFSLLPAAAMADWRDDVRQSLEHSMLLRGTISIDTAGKVSGYSLDEQDKLPDGLRGFVSNNILGWRFEPMQVDGQPATARNRMTMRVIAKPLENDQMQIRLSGVTFSPMEQSEGSQLTYKRQSPPQYPRTARIGQVQGTVYTAVKIGRDGKVLDTHANQVDLRTRVKKRDAERWREILAEASAKAIRRWTFNTPTEGLAADQDFFEALVPINFRLVLGGRAPRTDEVGEWQSYFPGPFSPAPWQVTDVNASAATAVADGELYLKGQAGRMKLLTPIGS